MNPNTLYECVEAIAAKYGVLNTSLEAQGNGVAVVLSSPIKRDVREAHGSRGVEALATDLKTLAGLFDLSYRTSSRDTLERGHVDSIFIRPKSRRTK
jgi:hypothetical protein